MIAEQPAEGYIVSRSFRFEPQDVDRLDSLSRKWRCSKAAVMRRLLAEAADREGLEQ